MKRTQDVLVAGGGPVGLAFAIAASALNDVRVTVIEKEPASPRPKTGAFDHRVYALSPASRRFLEAIGVWQHLEASRIAAVDAMQVWGDEGGAMELRQGAPLAFILEHGALLYALQIRAQELAERIRRIGGALTALDLTGVDVTARPVVTLDDGQQLAADLIIGADGAQSRVRACAGIAADHKDYQSTALVANFHCQRAHGHIARQWFKGEAVLAWLPLPQQQISLVWSLPAARAAEFAALSGDAFAAEVAAAGGGALGEFRLVSPVAGFPLRRQLAQRWTAPGLALLGDAAHTIHPLAGQGVNLGLGDAEALCGALRERGPLSAVGDLALLRKFERSRREPALAMAGATDRLQALFLQPSDAVKRLRNSGLATVDRLAFIKQLFMDYAMN